MKGFTLNGIILTTVCAVFAIGFLTVACHTPQTNGTGDPAAVEGQGQGQDLVQFKAASVNPAQPATPEPAKEEAVAEPAEPEGEKPAEKPVATTAPAVKPAGGGGADAKPESVPVVARVSLSGCLEKSKRRGGAEPKREPVSGPAVDNVRIQKGKSGIIVFHDLTHNCCFEADVQTSVKGTSVLVVEKLSGDTCRCRCNSTIRTDIGLETKKTYTVRVDVNENGQDRKVHQEDVSL